MPSHEAFRFSANRVFVQAFAGWFLMGGQQWSKKHVVISNWKTKQSWVPFAGLLAKFTFLKVENTKDTRAKPSCERCIKQSFGKKNGNCESSSADWSNKLAQEVLKK